MRIAVAAASIVVAVAALQGAQQSPAGQPAIVQKFLTADGDTLTSYRAVRRLVASTRGGRMRASLEARTTLNPATGFSYEIVSEEGSSLIRRKVLIAALEAERDAVASAESRGARLTPENYDFIGVSLASERLYKIDVRARRRHQMLIDGALFVDGESADLVRMEGELAKRPSFWTRRVRVVREYARIEGFHVPVSMQSTADVLIVGASNFSMTYTYVEINGHPVATEP